jgi:hypothetical protein
VKLYDGSLFDIWEQQAEVIIDTINEKVEEKIQELKNIIDPTIELEYNVSATIDSGYRKLVGVGDIKVELPLKFHMLIVDRVDKVCLSPLEMIGIYHKSQIMLLVINWSRQPLKQQNLCLLSSIEKVHLLLWEMLKQSTHIDEVLVPGKFQLFLK